MAILKISKSKTCRLRVPSQWLDVGGGDKKKEVRIGEKITEDIFYSYFKIKLTASSNSV
jgi:hypothetical protein